VPLLIGSMRFVVAFVVATALFWAGLLFEHRPHGWPNLKVAFFHLSLPDGPWAKLATAQRDLTQCRANTQTLSHAIDLQNAAVAAMKVEGDRLSADAAKAVQQAHTASLGLNRRASVLISTPPAGNDVCARAIDAFERVRGDLTR
jgi:hypothetical protein